MSKILDATKPKLGIITDQWNEYLKLFHPKDKDIYFTEEYVKLYESKGDKANCFVYTDEDRVFLMPYLKRKIEILDDSFYDFQTPYGYSGPLTTCRDQSFVDDAFNCFCDSLKQQNVVAGFIRFHPLLKNHCFVNESCKVVFNRKTIAMDLNLSKEEIWENHIYRKNRTAIRKAQKLGLSFDVDKSFEHFDDFLEIYTEILDKFNPDSFYYFNREYYEKLIRSFKDKSFLGLVRYEEKIISAIVFFIDGIYGHAHLGGSRGDYFKDCANNLLFYEAALYLKNNGAKKFHFGGGTTSSKEDSLYKFKRRFSKDHYEFHIGKMILNKEVYQQACDQWDKKFPDKKDKYKNIFLRYRY